MKHALSLLSVLLVSHLSLATDDATSAKSFEAFNTNGAKVSFPQDYKGKIVMLDFWATWCGPCVAEVPNLTKVHADLKAKGFEVLGISLDDERTKERLAQFTKDKGMTWPQICDGKGWEAELAKVYEVRSIPACFLVDGNTGKLIAKGTELRGASLRPTVEKALGLPPGGIAPLTSGATPATPPLPPDPLIAQAEVAAKRIEFMSNSTVTAQLKQPRPGLIKTLTPATQSLSSREVARLARDGHLRIGWYFRCTRCDKMHVNVAGAYAVAVDVVATANHVIEPPANLKEGKLIVVNEQGEFFSTTAVLAADASMDAALIRVSGGGLKPLPVRADVALGDRAYCFSDPLRHRGYFSDGIVNRFYSNNDSKDPVQQRVNVSTDWAQGSSGSAVLDDCGNIIGHVARIQTFNSNPPIKTVAAAPPTSSGTTLVLHEAIPASALMHLIQETNKAARN